MKLKLKKTAMNPYRLGVDHTPVPLVKQEEKTVDKKMNSFLTGSVSEYSASGYFFEP